MKQRIAFAITMACINASLISFILTAYNAGFSEDFLMKWAINSFSIVVPSIILVGPKVHNFWNSRFKN